MLYRELFLGFGLFREPGEFLEPGEPAAPGAGRVAVGVAEVLLDSGTDVSQGVAAHSGVDHSFPEVALDEVTFGEGDAVFGLPDADAAVVHVAALGVDGYELAALLDVFDVGVVRFVDVALVKGGAVMFETCGPVGIGSGGCGDAGRRALTSVYIVVP